MPPAGTRGLRRAAHWSTIARDHLGTGQFRATLWCDMPWQIDFARFGHWLDVTVPPSNSIATCPPEARKGYNPTIDRR